MCVGGTGKKMGYEIFYRGWPRPIRPSPPPALPGRLRVHVTPRLERHVWPDWRGLVRTVGGGDSDRPNG